MMVPEARGIGDVVKAFIPFALLILAPVIALIVVAEIKGRRKDKK
jgi:hypothetical protein